MKWYFRKFCSFEENFEQYFCLMIEGKNRGVCRVGGQRATIVQTCPDHHFTEIKLCRRVQMCGSRNKLPEPKICENLYGIYCLC